MVELDWISGTRGHSWIVIAPPVSSVQLPALPPELALFAPGAPSLSGAVELIESSAVGSLGGFHAAYPRLWDPFIDSTARPVPFIPAADFTTRMSYRSFFAP